MEVGNGEEREGGRREKVVSFPYFPFLFSPCLFHASRRGCSLLHVHFFSLHFFLLIKSFHYVEIKTNGKILFYFILVYMSIILYIYY